MTFGEKLYEIRKSIGLSQEQLAERCRITRQSVSKWELGQGYPETEKLLMLCRVLDVDLDYLLRDEIASQSTPSRQAISNPYQPYLGKWVTLLLYDRDFGTIPTAAITSMNDDYVIFEMNGKIGIIRTSDIKTISEAVMNAKKVSALSVVEVFELKNGDNPYKLFVGKKCTVKFKRGDSSRNVNLGGLPTAEIVTVADENMTILFKGREMVIKIKDILVAIEN